MYNTAVALNICNMASLIGMSTTKLTVCLAKVN